MAVRQYIGARYVPLYVGDWDSTKNYEPLSIVTDANGNSFTSLKDVPAGTPLNERTYWVQTSSFSGAIDTLNRRMGTAEDNIINLQHDVDELKREEKYVFFGDSYSENYSAPGEGNIIGWVDHVVSYLGLNASQWTATRVGGAGFIGINNAWIDALTSAAIDPDVTDVVFVGGTNDLRHINDPDLLRSAISQALNIAHVKYPNARISVGFCSFVSATRINDAIPKTLRVYEQETAKANARNLQSLPCVLLNMSYTYGDENGHPNNDGTRAIARAIVANLNGGTYNNIVPTTDVTFDDSAQGVQSSVHGQLKFRITDNIMTLWGDSNNTEQRWQWHVGFGAGINNFEANGTTTLIITKMTNLPIAGRGFVPLGVVSGFAAYGDGLDIAPCSVFLSIYDKYLQATVLDARPNTGYKIGKLITLYLSAPSFTIDILGECEPQAG